MTHSDSIRTADLIPLEQVSVILPSRPDRSTVFRWARGGCHSVRLRTVSVGRTLHTTERWLLAFFEEIAVARSGRLPATVAAQPRPTRSSSGPAEPNARTARILREHGLTETG